METTANALYNNFEGRGDWYPAIEVDLYGRFNWTSEMKADIPKTLSLFCGIYKGLYLRGITSDEIHKKFKENRLDELIHNTYLNSPSEYYRMFCEKSIKIGITYHDSCMPEDQDENTDSSECEDFNSKDNKVQEQKKPIHTPTAYNKYVCMQIKKLKVEHPSLSAKEIMKIACKGWTQLTQQEKESYK